MDGIALLESLGEVAPPPTGFWEASSAALKEALQREDAAAPHRRRRLGRWAAWATAAVAAASALTLLIMVVMSGTAGTPWRLTALFSASRFSHGASLPFAGELTCPSVSLCYAVKLPLSADSESSPSNISLSSDGGATWRDLSLPVGAIASTALSCPSTTTCMAAGAQATGALDDAGKGFSNPVLLRTTDGGSTWTEEAMPIPNLDPALPAGQAGFEGNVSQLACATGTTCVAEADVPLLIPASAFARGTPLIGPEGLGTVTEVTMRTDDGGAHWTDQQLPGLPYAFREGKVTTPIATAIGGDLVCPSAQTCIATASFTPSGPTTWTAWYSHDGGATWAKVGLPRGAALGPTVSCADATHCWLPTSAYKGRLAGAVLFSGDGGATWTRQSVPAAMARTDWTSMSCPTTLECWLAGGAPGGKYGHAQIASTEDGGKSWSIARIPDTAGPDGFPLIWGESIACPSAGSCVALAIIWSHQGIIGSGITMGGYQESVLTNAPEALQ